MPWCTEQQTRVSCKFWISLLPIKIFPIPTRTFLGKTKNGLRQSLWEYLCSVNTIFYVFSVLRILRSWEQRNCHGRAAVYNVLPQGLPILGENTHTYLIMYEWATTNRTQVGSDGKGTGVFIEKIPIIYQNFP